MMERNAFRAFWIVVVVLWFSTVASALEPVNATLFGRVAIKGYDAVAYFTEGQAVKGSKKFSHEYEGATWRFVSAANREVFAANPERYAPQYGGYCAWAVAQGSTADIDPEMFTIVDDKLYLNYDEKVQADWRKDIPGFIAAADVNWPRLLAE